ncbi:MAG: mandelate racemase/muconate lactonizing enzyme family protein [Chloroflexota bacterium]|nr:mandelate racemase/muconate lactonizing enzyme family protein [Chloroflexota bacterium]
MKISSFETKIVSLPLQHGSPSHGSEEDTFNVVTLRLRTNDGIEGMGYACFVPSILTRALNEVLNALLALTIGADPLMVEKISEGLLEKAGNGAPAGLVTRAVSCIDVALWDIKGKALGQPVYKLLGGYTDTVPAYASGSLWRPYNLDELGVSARDLVADGFVAMKLRVGAEIKLDREIERFNSVRDAVGPDIDIMIDVNQAWDLNTAISFGRRIDSQSAYWLEDPVDHQDVDGLAVLADKLDTPVVAGEYHYGITPFRYMLEKKSVDIVMVDLLRVGGLTQWVKVAHMAEIFNVPVVSHLATEVLVHAVAAVPNGLMVEHMPWTFPLFRDVPTVANGVITLSDLPGLGLEFDESTIAQYSS